MPSFSANVANDEDKVATPLGSQCSITEEFLPQSGNMAYDATVDILVIEFD